jgi:ethanolamine permease
MLAGGRSTFEFAKGGYAPAVLGRLSSRLQTPVTALILNMIIGIGALLTGKTGEIITIAVFGALTLYFISMLALIRLRQTEPELPRPFLSPGYPLFPMMALIISAASFIAMALFNFKLVMIYLVILGGSFAVYSLSSKK